MREVRIYIHNGNTHSKKSSSRFSGIYEKADYHGKKNTSIKNKAPNKGQ